MALQTFAAIYIGTYEVSLKIFEFSGKKKIHEIDHIRSRVELGRDAYTKGVIGYELVDELCDTLKEFSDIMKGYRVDQYEAYASAVLRDSSNELFILDQIRLRTGFHVQVISNSEHRFISYKSVAGREEFEKMIQSSAAVVDVGGAGLQITLFRNGSLVTTQHVVLGTLRLSDLLRDRSKSLVMAEKQIEELINKKLETLRHLYLKEEVEYIIFMGDYCMELMKHLDKNNQQDNVVRTEKFLKYIAKLQKKNVEEISAELNLANDNDPLIVPSILLFKALAENMKSHQVWVPGVNINDGIAYSYAERNHLVRSVHDFEQDIISAAMNLSRHYFSYSPHIEALTQMSTKIFDTMKKTHGLGNREKLLLEVATILHDCGKYVSFANSPECAYQIIMSSEIIGLTHLEREIAALTVLYNTLPLPEYEELSDRLDQYSYMVVAKLSAILRLSNALDQSHKQKFKNLRITIKGKELIITVESFEDISLEQALFEEKTAYFESVFSIKPVLKEKRIYNF